MDEALLSAVSGSIAGMGAMAITYPLVLVSTRNAVRSSAKPRPAAPTATAAAPTADTSAEEYPAAGDKSYAAVVKEGSDADAEAEAASKITAGGKATGPTDPLSQALHKALSTAARSTGTIGTILATEGPSGLYAGLQSSLVGIATTNLVYYGAYSLVSDGARKRSKGGETLTVGQSIVAGMVAGSATTVLTNPLWVVQAHQSTFTHLHPDRPPPSIKESVGLLYHQGGLGAFWRGIKAALILVTNPVLQYAAFEKFKALLLALRRRQQLARGPAASAAGAVVSLSSAELFALGALAKLFATGLSYPLVLLKSRLQSASHAYPSIPTALRSIVATEGLAGLYAGLRAKLLQSVLTAALLFAGQQRVYELAKGALGRR